MASVVTLRSVCVSGRQVLKLTAGTNQEANCASRPARGACVCFYNCFWRAGGVS